MNYAEYKILKDRLERKAKVLSIFPIFAFLAMIFQIVLLIVKVNTNATWFNFVLVDQLFSNARVFLGMDNIVLAVIFYISIILCVIIMAACVYFCYKNARPAYSLMIFFYLIDIFITILAVDYIQVGVHFVFLCFFIYARRTLTHLGSIPKEVWGYGE